ncbi:MAG: hypothetical protein LUC43_04330 [Burkholderiales bacterium]|nr:hypothetical protein [Burkholderiales bacterium]
MKLIRFATLIIVSSLIASCGGDVDPDKPVTQKTFEKAFKKFDKPEQEKINALGGESYFKGKSINDVRKSLSRDYLEKQKGELIEHVKSFKAQNVEKNLDGSLDLEQVQTLFARNDNERQTEVNETKAHQKYLNAVIEAEKKEDPLGFITAARTITPCVSPEIACMVTNLKGDPKAYNSEVRKRVAANECKQLIAPKNRKSGLRYEIEEVITYKRQTVYKTPVGWVAPSDVVGISEEHSIRRNEEVGNASSSVLYDFPPLA